MKRPDITVVHGECEEEAQPSSAGDCQVCGKYAEKRYGGMGRYRVMCIGCWEADRD